MISNIEFSVLFTVLFIWPVIYMIYSFKYYLKFSEAYKYAFSKKKMNRLKRRLELETFDMILFKYKNKLHKASISSNYKYFKQVSMVPFYLNNFNQTDIRKFDAFSYEDIIVKGDNVLTDTLYFN